MIERIQKKKGKLILEPNKGDNINIVDLTEYGGRNRLSLRLGDVYTVLWINGQYSIIKYVLGDPNITALDVNGMEYDTIVRDIIYSFEDSIKLLLGGGFIPSLQYVSTFEGTNLKIVGLEYNGEFYNTNEMVNEILSNYGIPKDKSINPLYWEVFLDKWEFIPSLMSPELHGIKYTIKDNRVIEIPLTKQSTYCLISLLKDKPDIKYFINRHEYLSVKAMEYTIHKFLEKSAHIFNINNKNIQREEIISCGLGLLSRYFQTNLEYFIKQVTIKMRDDTEFLEYILKVFNYQRELEEVLKYGKG